MMSTPKLPLNDMASRHRGLTPEIAGCYVQAAHVCLDRHHTPPTEFLLREGKEEVNARVEWEPTDERSRGAWANTTDATEAGAYACALAATELLKGLVAVRRAETATGADYYIAPIDQDADDLEGWLRLEVSGTDKMAEEVARRLKAKVAQAERGNSNLPALAAVVGFKAQLISIQAVVEAA